MIFNVRDGISRANRMIPYLNPDYFKIEDRDTGDFLKFSIELASLFNYYNLNNEVDGNWESFFDSDVDVLLALIVRLNIERLTIDFEQQIIKLTDVDGNTDMATILNSLLNFLYERIVLLHKFKIKLALPDNHNTNTAALVLIVHDVDKDIDTFISYYLQARQIFTGIKDFNLSAISKNVDVLNYGTINNNIWKKEVDLKEPTENSISYLQALFASIILRYSNLVIASKQYIQLLRNDGNVYDPHMGLFISFLQLYGYFKNDINKITARHLDYYYKEILAIKYRKAVADKIHIVFEAGATVSKYLLAKGENIIAEVPITKQKLRYEIESDTYIGNTIIRELKTQFISNLVQIPASKYGFNNVNERKIYKAEHPVVQPVDYLKNKDLINPWPLMGEEQNELPLNQRTMDDAIVGMLIAAPVLYLVDGKRSISVRFYISPYSSNLFNSYIDNFVGVAEVKKTFIAYELLVKAFKISFTGAKGWIPVEKYDVVYKLEINAKDSFIEFIFLLVEKDPPVDIFNPEVHGIGCKINTPAIKLEINNNSFHNAYSFLQDLLIERITLKAEVTGAQSMKLQNSFGPLSPLVPFQPFGPTPTIDSYFEVKNTNTFNRYTTKFQLQLEWFDLPKEPGGFTTYFNGYDNNITNDSFKIVLSTVQNGRNVQDDKMGITFNLFETKLDEYGHSVLKNDTQIKVTDFSRISFSNDLLMNLESDLSVTDLFKNGCVKIALTTPSVAFGNKVYPKLLPIIITKNARFFSKNVMMPNPPYMPVVKSLHVDYVLEQNEILTNGQTKSTGNGISLVHLYPFGYNEVYPIDNGKKVYIMPLLEEGSSLMIGLENTVPEQEISLLFQLQDTNFQNTVVDVVDNKWSYLLQNTWLNFNPYDVISDSTNNFSNSGVVKLLLPSDVNTGNTILNAAIFWIRVSIPNTKIKGSRLIGLFTQASTAVRVMDNVAESVPENLTSGAIKDFTRKIPEILKIHQFFPSFGGRREETIDSYRLRTSERLRHKDRPLSTLDITQMVLETFPEILMAKCFSPSKADKFILPYVNAQIVVIPKEKENSQFLTEEPKVSLSTLLKIKKYLNNTTSCFANIEVGNPVYEKIKIVCCIKIKKDNVITNDGHYLKMLNEDIKRFITPWLYDLNKEIKIGGQIFIIDVLNFICKLPYISYATGFSALHFYKRINFMTHESEAFMEDTKAQKNDYFKASRPDAILIASNEHSITVLDSFTSSLPIDSGIGNLVLGSELSILSHSQKDKDNAKLLKSREQEEYYDFKFQ